MGISGMSRFLRWFFGTLLAILLGFLGIERKKNQMKDVVIKEQNELIKQQKKQTEVLKVAQELRTATKAQMEKIESGQKIEEKRIEKTSENVDETIAIANDIVSRFNAH